MAARAEIALPTRPKDTKPVATRCGGSILAGWLIILVAFGGFAAWSVYAPLATAVLAQGTVVVKGSRKTVQHLEGGIVRQILVADGDHVKAGQVLLRLDDSQVRADLALLQGRYDDARAEQARLVAERDGASAITFPPDLVARAAHDGEAAAALTGQRGIFTSRRNTLLGQTSILENRIAQSKAEIAGLTLQQNSKERQEALINQELGGLRTLHAKGYASGSQVLSFERQAASLDGERGQVMATIATVREGIGEANLQILQLQKSFLESAEKDLRDTETNAYDMEERVRATTDQLARLTVRAPATGVVVGMRVHTVGGVIAPGGEILDIVPSDDQLIVEAQIHPDDIDNIHPGLPATIRFSAFNRNTTPVIAGKVIFVSADRMVEQRTGASFYTVRVQVTPEGRSKLGNLDLKLLPGMPAEVIIKKGQHTLLDYLTSPLSDTLAKAFSE